MSQSSPYGRLPHGPTRTLSEFTSRLTLSQLPEEVIARAKQIISDTIACGIAAGQFAPDVFTLLTQYLATYGSAGPSLLMGTDMWVAAPLAAYGNAALSHSLDFDDAHIPSIAHFGAPATAATLAALGPDGDGSGLIVGVVAGFEAGGKIGRAVMPAHYRRWHSTSSLGGIAAAASAAHALGLDPEQTDVAISLAADDAGGTRYCNQVGDVSKSLHAGAAAFKGVAAATMARFTANGPTGLIEHPNGFLWAYADGSGTDELLSQLSLLGDQWEVLADDLKPFPSIRISHGPVEAVLELVADKALQPADVKEIRVYQPPSSFGQGWGYEPDTVLAARLSIPYCVATAFVHRELGLEQFAPEELWNPHVRTLMQKVRSIRDPDLYTRWGSKQACRVEISGVDGRVYTSTVAWPLGSPRAPMEAAQHQAKVRKLLETRLSSDQAERLGNLVLSLERLDSLREIHELLADNPGR